MNYSRVSPLWLVIIFSIIIPTGTLPFFDYANNNYGYAQDSYFANLEGYIVSNADNIPVQNAVINILPLGEIIFSDENGYFSLENIPIPEQILQTKIIINAAGFGEWVLQDVRLVANDTLILHPKLTTDPFMSIVPPPRSTDSELPPQELFMNSSILTTADLSADQPIPRKIRVRISGYSYHCDTDRDYVVEIVDFIIQVDCILVF